MKLLCRSAKSAVRNWKATFSKPSRKKNKNMKIHGGKDLIFVVIVFVWLFYGVFVCFCCFLVVVFLVVLVMLIWGHECHELELFSS